MDKFTDTISPHSHTIPVIKKLLTFYDLEVKKSGIDIIIYRYMKNQDRKLIGFLMKKLSGIHGNVAVALGRQSDKNSI